MTRPRIEVRRFASYDAFFRRRKYRMQQAALNPADTPTQRLKRLASMRPQAFGQRPAILHRRQRRATPANGTIAERA
ncbi:hypothetical protein RALBFv3_17290 (plasmid) [Ralstonia solanacearum]|nr:hypothetical protein RALBFv3_17290 [Ralstonia solanacearum]AYB62662.1 hypothetical protein C2124_19280 [Ralstonia solanacearum]EUJ12813.1 hypothetical protein RSP673_19130 [Ralstonia solanacearum P673]OAI68487.1 hypothetical protein RSP797_19480 [Ralstonia solanacearum]